MRFLFTIVCSIFIANQSGFAQNAIVGTGFSWGWGLSCDNNFQFDYFASGAGASYIRAKSSNSSGNKYFRLAVDWGGTISQRTITEGVDVAVSPGNTYTLSNTCTTNGSMYINTPSVFCNYIFKTRNAGPSPSNQFVFFEIQGGVRVINSVSHISNLTSTCLHTDATVTAVLDASLNAGQKIYLRYSSDNFATSTIVPMTGSGTSLTCVLSNITSEVKYYAFSSGLNTPSHADADFYTINLNNNNGANYRLVHEGGLSPTLGTRPAAATTRSDWHINWSSTLLQLVKADGDYDDMAVVYLIDKDPTPIPNAGIGLLESGTDFGINMQLPFNADMKVVMHKSTVEIRHAVGGSWSAPISLCANGHDFYSSPNYSQKDLVLNMANLGIDLANIGMNILAYEIEIPLGSINAAYGSVQNQVGSGREYFYFKIPPGAPASEAFSRQCFVQSDGGNYIYGADENDEYIIHDFIINDNSSNNNDNIGGNQSLPNRVTIFRPSTIINGNIYIGQGSALFTQDDVVFTIAGNSSMMEIHGRLDANPDVNNVVGKRLSFIIDDGKSLTIHSTVDKSLARFSNITVGNGATLQGSSTATGDIELQFGTLVNNGSVNFNNLPGNSDVTIRGTLGSILNEYIFDGTGSFQFYRLVIGNQNTRLRPAASAGAMEINVAQNLEVYHHLDCVNGTGRLNFTFNGTGNSLILADRGQTTNTEESNARNIVFNNLTINKTSGDVFLHHDAGAGHNPLNSSPTTEGFFVDGVLTLTNGDLVSRNRNSPSTYYTLGVRSGGSVSGGSASSYVDGPLVKYGNAAFVYPIGKGGKFRKAGISAPTNTASYFTAEFFNSGFGDYSIATGSTNMSNVSLMEYWDLARGGSSDAVFVSLCWENAASSGIYSLNEMKVAHYNGSDWEDANPSIVPMASSNAFVSGNASAGSVTSAGPQSSFSPFAFGSARPSNTLPVELVYFKGRKEGEKALLEWATATERNNDYFEVERISGGGYFTSIGRVVGNLNSTELLRYSFIDPSPLQATNYYRIKQVDLDGAYHNTEIVSVDFSSANSFVNIYPVPTKGDAYLEIIAEESGDAAVDVFDAAGRKVDGLSFPLDKGLNNYVLNTDSYPKGTYLIRINMNNRILTKYLVKN